MKLTDQFATVIKVLLFTFKINGSINILLYSIFSNSLKCCTEKTDEGQRCSTSSHIIGDNKQSSKLNTDQEIAEVPNTLHLSDDLINEVKKPFIRTKHN